MALFGKRRNQNRDPDEALPFLTVDDADHLRSLVRTAMAQQGLEVTVYMDTPSPFEQLTAPQAAARTYARLYDVGGLAAPG